MFTSALTVIVLAFSKISLSSRDISGYLWVIISRPALSDANSLCFLARQINTSLLRLHASPGGAIIRLILWSQEAAVVVVVVLMVVVKAYRGVPPLIKPTDKTDCPWSVSLNGAAVDCQLTANCVKSWISLHRGDAMLFKGKYNIWYCVGIKSTLRRKKKSRC